MIINSNPAALNSARVLADSNKALSKSLARLSSGSRIVSPEDDAAGLAVSTKFKSELARIGAARTNVSNAASFSQTQDGFLKSVDTALRRMSELATLATDQTKVASDVANYDREFQELKAFIKASSTKTFNGVSLFGTGTALGSVTVGAGASASAVDLATSNSALTTAITNFKAASTDATLLAMKEKIAQLAFDIKKIAVGDGALAVTTAASGTPATGGGFGAAVTAAAAQTAAQTYLELSMNLNKTYTTQAMGTTTAATQSTAQINGLIALAEDLQAFVAAKFTGLKVTDSSDGTGYQLKGIDMNSLKADVELNTGNLTTLTIGSAAGYVTTLNTHINTLAANRAYIGANISRLNSVDSQLAIYNENLAAANSRIEDVDVATESSNYAKQQILVQSGTAMLSQANLLPQSALKLIG